MNVIRLALIGVILIAAIVDGRVTSTWPDRVLHWSLFAVAAWLLWRASSRVHRL